MKILVACPDCRRQFDAANLPVGSRFHCRCGRLLRVPAVEAKEAAVVRCSSCGGPRTEEAKTCRYCGADFTVQEQDRATICSQCMARIGNRARYCHHCGTAVVVEGQAGSAAELPCPACGDSHRLHHRTLGPESVALLECPRCAGLWVGQETFRALTERARDRRGAPPDREGLREERRRQIGNAAPPPASGPLYRRCPECRDWMHRHNFGRTSGVIVDACHRHGLWFDADELEALLRWVRQGGEVVARERADDERRRERERKLLDPIPADTGGPTGGPPTQLDLIGGMLTRLFDLL